MKKLQGIIQIKKEEAQRINSLLDIEDFEESKRELDELGFSVDSRIISYSTKVDGYIFGIDVFTGQTNAWIDYSVTDSVGNTYEGEPGFGPVEGEYFISGDDFEIEVSVEIIE